MSGTLHGISALDASGNFRGDEIESLADCVDAFKIAFRHRDTEFFFKSHDELDEVQAVGAEVFFELGFHCDLVCFNRQNIYSAFLETIE